MPIIGDQRCEWILQENQKLGEGGQGCVIPGNDTVTGEEVAVKIGSSASNSLRREYSFYQYIHRDKWMRGIPMVHFHGRCGKNSEALVMERLGFSMADYMNIYNGKLSAEFPLVVGIQALRRLESIHNEGIIHNDVKPENFLTGKGKSEVLYLIDFGMAQYYLNPETLEHIPERNIKTRFGTVKFASRRMHDGHQLSRRDDLESLGYMLVFLIKGVLPWHKHEDKSMNRWHSKSWETKIWNDVGRTKKRTEDRRLCENMPCSSHFQEYFEKIRALAFEERPKYDSLVTIFQRALEDIGHENFHLGKSLDGYSGATARADNTFIIDPENRYFYSESESEKNFVGNEMEYQTITPNTI